MRVNSPGVASTRDTVLRHTRERKRKRGRPGSVAGALAAPSFPPPCAWSPQLAPPPVAPVQTCRSPHLLTLAPAKMNSGTEAAAREGKREDARTLAHTESGGPRSREAGPARPGTSEEMLFVVSTASCVCVSLSHAGARDFLTWLSVSAPRAPFVSLCQPQIP